MSSPHTRSTVLDVGLVGTFATQAHDKLAGADAATKAAIAGDLAVADRLIEAARAGLLADVERGEDFRDDGHASTRAWLRASVRTSDSEALHHVRVRPPLRRPARRAPRAGGRTPRRRPGPRARRARANPRCGDQLHVAIDVLLESAEQDPFEDFVEQVRQWERLADADGAHRDHEAAHEGRRARITTVGDTTYLDASTGNAQGAAMTEVLERFAQAEFEADWAETVLRHGDHANPGLLPRTDVQRRADALHAIFQRVAGSAPGTVEPEPVVNIVITQELFEAQVRAMVTDGPLDRDGLSVTGQFCRSANGLAIDPADAVAARTRRARPARRRQHRRRGHQLRAPRPCVHRRRPRRRPRPSPPARATPR